MTRHRRFRRFGVLSALLCGAIGVLHGYSLLREAAAAPLICAAPAERLVDDDARQPRGQGRAAFETGNVCEGRQIGSLHGILSLRSVLEYAPGGSEQSLVVGREKLAARRRIACCASAGKFDIPAGGAPNFILSMMTV